MVLPNLKPNLIKIRLEMRSIPRPNCLKSLAMTTEDKLHFLDYICFKTIKREDRMILKLK